MPHDSKGVALQPGDTVTITFTVVNVMQAENACNVTLEALDVARTGEYKPIVSCNARLVTKAKPR